VNHNAKGGLFHVIGRGLERRKIFSSSNDKADFLQRVGNGCLKHGHKCYAWALMDNHYHFLLRQGDPCLSIMFGPTLGAYAQSYNKRHNRVGYLFQGRFKSILCEENTYMLELIRYIHLNPLKAGVVENLSQLARYQ
jgi:putative transposase